MFASALRRYWVLFASILLIAATPPTLAQPAPAAPPAKAAELPPIPATSALLIVDTSETNGGAESELLLQRRINTHIVALRSESTIRQMITNINSEARKTNWFTSSENPHERIAWLRDHLHVAQVSGTALIEVSLPDVADRKERRTILRELCDTYIANERDRQNDVLGDRTKMLNTIKIKIELRLSQLSTEMHNKQISLNQDGGGIGKLGVKELELSKLASEIVEAQLRAEKAKSTFDTILEATKQGTSVPEVEAVVQANTRIQELQRRLDDAEIRLDIANAKSAKDPANAELRAEVDVLQKRLRRLTEETAARARVEVVEKAQLQAVNAANQLEGLSRKVSNLKADLGDLNNNMVTYNTLKDEDKVLREQLRSVRQQVEQVMALQSTSGTIGIYWQAQPEAE